jgi:precorrin-6B methylase 2
MGYSVILLTYLKEVFISGSIGTCTSVIEIFVSFLRASGRMPVQKPSLKLCQGC